MNTGLLLALFAAGMTTGILAGRSAVRIWLGGTLVGAGAAIVAASQTLLTGATWDWQPAFAIGAQPVHLRLDAVGAWFLMLIAVVGGAATVYSRDYWSSENHPASAPAGRCWWSAVLLSMGLVVLCANGLHFLLAWETFAIAAYFLVTLDRKNSETRAAGWLYLAASHGGTLCLFGLFTTLAARTGSWELGDMREHTELAPLFWLVLAGFGVKAGLFGLHIWLPSAHANAPSHVSALMSGVAIKMGIYGIVRFSGWLPVPVSAAWFVAIIGVGSAVLGVVFALGQHDLKRLLAYHSVENVGIILMGVGFGLVGLANGDTAWGRLAFAGGLLHVWNHGLFKSLLFLGAGSVLHATGTREMSRLGGLWRGMPWTAGLFALGAAAISGLPPLNGFVSEFLVYLGLVEAVNAHGGVALPAMATVVLLAMTGALALACFVKVCGVVFLGAPRSEAAQQAHECGPLMRGPMLLLAGLCTLIGLAPVLFWSPVSRASVAWHPAWSGLPAPAGLRALTVAHPVVAVAALMGVALLFRRVQRSGGSRAPTWDCGYAAPAARMQYTAGSFAGIITAWFEWVLRRERHVQAPEKAFPRHAGVVEHTPETVLETVFKPAADRTLRAAALARSFQHGRLQSYLLYLVAGLIVLAIVTVWPVWQ
ncbi:MAG: NADH-quinone oxidoreductase subunit H [Verrucomicrobiales bacterium]|nr:NADH-quinone oxidoreductase subunit H [Verrucomicrobiales bacterium]